MGKLLNWIEKQIVRKAIKRALRELKKDKPKEERINKAIKDISEIYDIENEEGRQISKHEIDVLSRDEKKEILTAIMKEIKGVV